MEEENTVEGSRMSNIPLLIPAGGDGVGECEASGDGCGGEATEDDFNELPVAIPTTNMVMANRAVHTRDRQKLLFSLKVASLPKRAMSSSSSFASIICICSIWYSVLNGTDRSFLVLKIKVFSFAMFVFLILSID